MRPLADLIHSLRSSVKTRHPLLTRRSLAWLPWLMVALIIGAALSPGQITASSFLFQSSPPQPIPPTATPMPPPPPPPTDTPLPPAATSVPPSSTPPIPPTQAPTVPPAQPSPVEPVPTQPAAEPGGAPTQELPIEPTEPIQPPTPALDAAPSAPTEQPPVSLRSPRPEGSTQGESGQPVINWIKFWDTMAVVVAYPWLCCGVSLLLLVPVALLFLEIKGRRRPPAPPEHLPGEKMSRRRRRE